MATRYIHFTEEQKQAARQIDIAGLLHSQGETLKRSGSEYEWRDGSAKVTVRGNLWYHQYEEVGGDAIDFVRRYYNKSYPEAVEYLLGGCSCTLAVSPPIEKETKPFELPPKNDRLSRVYAYLIRHRKIDKDVLDAFAVSYTHLDVYKRQVMLVCPLKYLLSAPTHIEWMPRHTSWSVSSV